MANTFRNARQVMGVAMATIYTCPSNTVALVIGSQIANVDTAANAVSLQWLDSSAANAVTRLLNAMNIPTNISIIPVGKNLALEAGDAIQGQCSVASKSEITLTILEMPA
jgi:hypothetical protein